LNWGTLGAKSTTMSDDVPLRLPRYVFRRSNGSFRYKRNVPERLRPLIGKATLYRQLGDSYREAMQALPLVHARIEALLNVEADKSARERSLEIIRGALGDEVAEMVLAELPSKASTNLGAPHSVGGQFGGHWGIGFKDYRYTPISVCLVKHFQYCFLDKLFASFSWA